jgi:LysM repeat protein
MLPPNADKHMHDPDHKGGTMLRRSHFLVLIAIPVSSIIVAWAFCMQKNLQKIAQNNIRLEENLQALQAKLDRLDKKAKNEAFVMAKSESEVIQEDIPSESNEVITGDSLVETIHIVQAGENLHRIGMEYGVSWTTLVKHNSLHRPNTICVGQELKIPFSQARTSTPTSICGAPHS